MSVRRRMSRGRVPAGPDSIVKNTASSFAAQLTTASLTAVLTVFLVRALGPAEYGLFALTVGIGSISIAFADFGISSSTARFVAERRARHDEVGALIADSLKLKLVVTGFVCAAIAALASVIAHAYGDPRLTWPLRGMAIATFGQSMFLMLLAVSTALGRAAVNVRLVATESALELSASVALVLAGAGAAGAAFGRAGGYVLGAAIAGAAVLRLTGRGRLPFWRRPQRATVRRVGGYAGAVFVIDVAHTVSSNLNVLLLGAFVGSAASGTFQAPWKLITLIQYVGLSTANGVAPRLARRPGHEPNVGALHAAIRGLIGFQCLLLAPAIVWAGPITGVLLGRGYAGSADALTALAPYIFLSGLAPLLTNGITYFGQARRRLPISITTVALTAAGGLILIPRHGLVGAALATDIGYGFYTLAHLWLCHRLLGLRLGTLAWSLACGLTAAAAMALVLALVGTSHLSPLDWLKGGAGGLAAYVGMLVFSREIRWPDIVRAARATSSLARRAVRALRAARLRPVAGPLPATANGGPAADVLESSPVSAQAAALEVAREAVARAAQAAAPPLPPAADPGRRRARLRTLVAGPRAAAESPAAAPPGSVGGGVHATSGTVAGRRSPAAEPPEWVRRAVAAPLAGAPESPPARSPAAEPPERTRPEAAPPPAAGGDRHANHRTHSAAADPPDWMRPERAPSPAPAPAPHAGRRAHSPAADPPEWMRPETAYGPPADGSEPGSRRRARSPAADPPAWLRSDAPPGGPERRPTAADAAARRWSRRASRGGAARRGAVGPTHEIAWRSGAETGAFELRPVGSDGGAPGPAGGAAARPVAQSSAIRWGWRMPPAPVPDARRAHDELVRRLVDDGWQRAGSGDLWFAHRFRPPNGSDDEQAGVA